MIDFEKLNRETREYNNRNVNRYNDSTPTKYNGAYWIDRNNNSAYKENNGQYNKKYY